MTCKCLNAKELRLPAVAFTVLTLRKRSLSSVLRTIGMAPSFEGTLTNS